MSTNFLPSSLSGHLLLGDSIMRFIMMDEAGTSESENVQIVAGVIVHADKQALLAERLISEINAGLPPAFRTPGVVFHATQLWNDREHKEAWSLSARMRHMERMMAIPRRLGMSLAYSTLIKNQIDDVATAAWRETGKNFGMSLAEFQHFSGMCFCLSAADEIIRDHAGPSEVGMVVGESITPKQLDKFKRIPQIMRDGWILQPGLNAPTEAERVKGYTDQIEEYRITRIRGTVHFVGKTDEPLLQLADACAFGLRRYFEGQDHGDRFAQAILGYLPNRSDFTGANASKVVWPNSV